MIIRNHPITPRRGNELSAQGIALGTLGGAVFALQGQKNDFCEDSFALEGRLFPHTYTQGVALG